MGVLKIIVTGDDFGCSIDANSHIECCHKNGILSSTSLIANGEAFDDAVEIAMRNPTLGIGVHLVIDEFKPIYNEMSSIIDPKTNLFYSPNVIEKYIKTIKYREADLIKEYSSQIEKILNSGISITHVDHHHHYHLHWPILNAVIKVVKRFNIRYVRSQKLILSDKNKFHKTIYRMFHQLYLKSRVLTTDGYFDLVHKEFEKMYESMNQLVTSNYRIVELVAHPCAKNDYQVTFLTNKKVINLMKSCDLVHFGKI